MIQDYSFQLLRRAHDRFNVEAQATLIAEGAEERPSILKDLSARGAGVASNYPLDVRGRVKIIMRVPFLFSNPIQRTATVAWCRKVAESLWEAGLDFGLDNKISLGEP